MKENTFLMAKQAGATVAKAKRTVSEVALRAGVAVVAIAGPAAAFADATDTAITDSGVKMVGYATAVVGIMVAFWAVKRGGQKMGWW